MLYFKNIYIYFFSFVFLTFKPDGRHHDHNTISLLLGWIFFSSPLLGQMYEFITDVPAECQIPWRKIFPPWAKMLHLIRSFCHLHLSPFPPKFVFTAVTSPKLLFFFTPPHHCAVIPTRWIGAVAVHSFPRITFPQPKTKPKFSSGRRSKERRPNTRMLNNSLIKILMLEGDTVRNFKNQTELGNTNFYTAIMSSNKKTLRSLWV